MTDDLLQLTESWAPTRADGDIYAGVVVEPVEATSERPLSGDQVDQVLEWLDAVEPRAEAVHASGALVRALHDPRDGTPPVWFGQVDARREIELIAAVRRSATGEDGAVRLQAELLAGWWAFALSQVATIAPALGLGPSRLHLFLHPYGRGPQRAVGFAFADCPPARQRVRGHQISPWQGTVEPVEPTKVPATVLRDAIAQLLDRFSYGSTTEALAWVLRTAEDGSLATYWTASRG
jgi:hypothetical protein